LGLLLLFWGISLRHLTVVPPVYEDEPWQASTGWKLAGEGVFGTDLFAGFAGMENRYYGYMPLHPVLLAGLFRLAGVGLFQDRFETVAMGLLTLALTVSVARRLFGGWRIGLLALLFLLIVRLTVVTPARLTGILFLDIARIARYDMVVPVFGLAAFYVYLRCSGIGQSVSSTTSRAWRRGCFVAGALVALAGLAHLYGLFWLPVLVVLILWNRPPGGTVGSTGRRARLWGLGALLVGFILPWLPYLAYVVQDVPAWRGQTSFYGDRFDLFDPAWYLENLRLEVYRYASGLEPGSPGTLLRPGWWMTVIGLSVSLLALAWRGWHRREASARALAVPGLLMPVLFAVLIRLKLANYLVVVLPIWAVAISWGASAVWDWAGRRAPARRGLRAALLVLLTLVALEGATRVVALERTAQTTTPYAQLTAQIRQALPPAARVLVLHAYWLGLHDYDVRSFAVPVLWTDPVYTEPPLSFTAGLDRIAPDVVIVDPRMRAYFAHDDARSQANAQALADWLTGHQAQRVTTFDDPTYGQFDIYQVPRR
jgi:4-amino-4-deoxy-L-arabinose transferase-like glycosyltransferase